MANPLDDALQRYIKFYETLTPQTLDSINDVFTSDARFRDPFNDARGTAHIRKIFADMFKTVGAPDFTITSYGWSAGYTRQAFLRWKFIYRVGGKGEPVTVEGMSDVLFDESGKVASHLDFWDAAGGLYEHLPVIGGILRFIRKKIES